MDIDFLTDRIDVRWKYGLGRIVAQNNNVRLVTVIGIVDPPSGGKLQVHDDLGLWRDALNNRVPCRPVPITNRNRVRQSFRSAVRQEGCDRPYKRKLFDGSCVFQRKHLPVEDLRRNPAAHRDRHSRNEDQVGSEFLDLRRDIAIQPTDD